MSYLSKMEDFINEYQSLSLIKKENKTKAMVDFILSFRESQHSNRKQKKSSFNIFSFFNIDDSEILHSKFLAWLLDKNAGHYQGDIFFKAFIKSCSLDIKIYHSDPYTVKTEFSGYESIIDILIYKKFEFLIYLENKVWSSEGKDQIQREFRDMRRLGISLSIPNCRQYSIFLTPDGRSPVSGDEANWRAVSYGDIADAFKELLPSLNSNKVRYLLNDWIETAYKMGGL